MAAKYFFFGHTLHVGRGDATPTMLIVMLPGTLVFIEKASRF
jgi:hypothetical protein